jgi:hypothetical protein
MRAFEEMNTYIGERQAIRLFSGTYLSGLLALDSNQSCVNYCNCSFRPLITCRLYRLTHSSAKASFSLIHHRIDTHHRISPSPTALG